MSAVLTLFGGIAGSVVASIVTFSAAVWTFRRSQARDQDRDDKAAEARDVERRNEAIVEAIDTLRALQTEVKWMPLRSGRSESASLRATMLFYLFEKPFHPVVADWFLRRHEDFVAEPIARWRRWWWVPILNRRRVRSLGEHLAGTLGALVSWSVGDLDDEDFDPAGATLPPAIAANLARNR